MKRKLHFWVIAGTMLLALFACHDEEKDFLPEERNISVERAKQFLERLETEKKRNGIDFEITARWETFKEDTNQKSGEIFAFVDVLVSKDNAVGKAIFSEEEDDLQVELYFSSTEKDSVQWMKVTDANGLFQRAFVKESEGTLYGRRPVRKVVVMVGIDPEMPDLYPDDPSVIMVDQHGNPLEPSIRQNYTYKIQQISQIDVNNRRGLIRFLRGRGAGDKEIKYVLEAVTVVHHIKRQDIANSNPADLMYIANFFYSRSNGIDDFYTFIDLKKDEPKNSGGGGGNPPKRNKPDDKIEDKLTNRCAKRILSQMRNSTDMKNFLKGANLHYNRHSFSEMIIDLFEKSSQTHLTFINGTTPNGANGSTLGTTITLNNNYLRRATDLSIARTMIHEMLHAYLNVNYSRKASDVKDDNFHQVLRNYFLANYSGMDTGRAQHEFFGEFIDAMAISLQQWDIRYGTGTDLGFEYYKAQSYGGLFQVDVNGNITTETDSFKRLVPNVKDRQDIANKILNEQNNTKNAKGTKCK